ncbi:unnamed protein product [Trichogramma brassicae]|uniref:Uncharacterized protein n=1 Tax=Trichogramma brassicae TaxID=86971 RepID=A0A6H5J177_9HYME|nr:unnamed protein product [Trichogramma brassicae]
MIIASDQQRMCLPYCLLASIILSGEVVPYQSKIRNLGLIIRQNSSSLSRLALYSLFLLLEYRVCVLAILAAHPALSVPSDDTADPARPFYVRGQQTGPEESSVLRDPGDEVVHPCGLGPRARQREYRVVILLRVSRRPSYDDAARVFPCVIVSVRASARSERRVQRRFNKVVFHLFNSYASLHLRARPHTSASQLPESEASFNSIRESDEALLSYPRTTHKGPRALFHSVT